MKNSNESIGKRSRDLPAYSAMPQPNAPRRTTDNLNILIHIHISTQLHVSAADRQSHGYTNMFKVYSFAIKFVM